MSTKPLCHADPEKPDDVLRAEAKAHLEASPALQVMAEILIVLRVAGVSWWAPEQLRARWGTATRMRWFAERPDLRQEITTALTGLVFNTARRKSPEFQAELIESVIEDSDIGAQHFEGAFDPRDVVVYGPVAEYWREIMASAPWHEEIPGHAPLVAAILGSLTAEKSALFGWTRTPLLSAYDVRAAIGARAWQLRLPLDVRVALDHARLAREATRPNEPFLAKDELGIVTPKVLSESFGLRDLEPVFQAAGTAMELALVPTRSDVVLVAPDTPVETRMNGVDEAPRRAQKGARRAS